MRSPGTARRLFFAFAALVLTFAAASFFALERLGDVHQSLHAARAQKDSTRAALTLAARAEALAALDAESPDSPALATLQQQLKALSDELISRALTERQRDAAREIAVAREGVDQQLKLAPGPERHAEIRRLATFLSARAEGLAALVDGPMDDLENHAGAVHHAFFSWTLGLLLFAVLFAIAVGAWIVRSIAGPVALLEAGAARIAKGDLTTPIVIESADEFGRLATQFNAMTLALREHQERLLQTEKLAGLGRLAAGVAHEINNPLGVILGYVKLLEAKAEGAAAEDLAIVREEALRCQEIVEGMLDLARPFKAGQTPVDLRELCDEVAKRLSEVARKPKVRITVAGSGEAPGSPQSLRQVVTNLVKNAVEASGEEGRVEVVVSDQGGGVEIAVSDSGKGVPEELRARLFEPFFTTKPDGTGLGLAVSQVIAQAHGGTIRVGAPRAGALFTLRLPRARA